MVLTWSGKMLLWGQSYNAGHLWLAEESRLQECSWHWAELIRSWSLHPRAGLSFYSWSYFLSCVNCGELRIYLWKQGFLSQVTAALHPAGGHSPGQELRQWLLWRSLQASQGVCAGWALLQGVHSPPWNFSDSLTHCSIHCKNVLPAALQEKFLC